MSGNMEDEYNLNISSKLLTDYGLCKDIIGEINERLLRTVKIIEATLSEFVDNITPYILTLERSSNEMWNETLKLEIKQLKLNLFDAYIKVYGKSYKEFLIINKDSIAKEGSNIMAKMDNLLSLQLFRFKVKQPHFKLTLGLMNYQNYFNDLVWDLIKKIGEEEGFFTEGNIDEFLDSHKVSI